jgi:hypothetical protein
MTRNCISIGVFNQVVMVPLLTAYGSGRFLAIVMRERPRSYPPAHSLGGQ